MGKGNWWNQGVELGAWQRLGNGTLDLVLVGIPLADPGSLLPTVVDVGEPRERQQAFDRGRRPVAEESVGAAPRERTETRRELREEAGTLFTGGEAGVDVLAGERDGVIATAVSEARTRDGGGKDEVTSPRLRMLGSAMIVLSPDASASPSAETP